MPKRYAYSLNGENYVGSFESRDQALAAGLSAATDSMMQAQSVFVGQRVEADAHASGHARTVLREMAWQAHDEVGAPAANYLNHLSDQQIDHLDSALEVVILQWLGKNNLLPAYFKVEGIGEYPVPSPAAAVESKQSDEVQQSIGS